MKVIGYVYTDYAGRRLTDVLADIDAYYEFYSIDGIFIDEMANDPDELAAAGGMTVQAYYERIYRHVNEKFWSCDNEDVVGNPGSAADTAWQIDTPVVDTLVVFEGTGPSYVAWDPPDWVMQRYGQFSHLVYDAMPSQRQEICSLFRSRHGDLVYVTDDEMPNPWDTLPSYWSLVAPKCV